MPLRPPLTVEQLHEIGARRDPADASALLWEIKRLQILMMRIDQVQQGMAWAYTKHLTDQAIYRAQQSAETNRAGLWADAGPVAPWEWRQESKTATLAPTAQIVSGCFTGPKGGTYTITASGRKDYNGC